MIMLEVLFLLDTKIQMWPQLTHIFAVRYSFLEAEYVSLQIPACIVRGYPCHKHTVSVALIMEAGMLGGNLPKRGIPSCKSLFSF